MKLSRYTYMQICSTTDSELNLPRLEVQLPGVGFAKVVNLGTHEKSRVKAPGLIFSSLVRIHIYVVPFLMLRFGLCTLLNPFGVDSRSSI